ncbi:arsenate reductase/protein-tyrosine-phosphatase family protein [Vibrio paucivorans]
MTKILFLCSGNYYRSRFCELYFNHQAAHHALPHRASSAALLRILDNTGNEGAIAKEVLNKLKSLDAQLIDAHRMPRIAHNEDLTNADLVYAASESEHRPMVAQHFPQMVNKVQFFQVEDVPIMTPNEAFALLTAEVDQLIHSLRSV